MLIIRKTQWDVLSKISSQRFETRMVIHLQRFWPKQCDDLGENGVLESIRKGVRNARSYGLEYEYDIQRYLNIMYTIGFDFDDDERYLWALEILSNPNLKPRERINVLIGRVEKELQSQDSI